MNHSEKSDGEMELATFYLGDACCGINILTVQEINRLNDVTPVPLAPDYVKGIMNLRGQIITVIDVGKRLGMTCCADTGQRRNIIVRHENESIGLVVDRIEDVIRTRTEDIEKPPANVRDIQERYFDGVLKTDKRLVSVLNLAEVLRA